MAVKGKEEDNLEARKDDLIVKEIVHLDEPEEQLAIQKEKAGDLDEETDLSKEKRLKRIYSRNAMPTDELGESTAAFATGNGIPFMMPK